MKAPAAAHLLLPCEFGPMPGNVTLEDATSLGGSNSSRSMWLDATESLLWSFGDEFGVFIPLLGVPRARNLREDTRLLVKQLHSRFSEVSTTWLFHAPASEPTVRCGNMLWTHKVLTGAYLDNMSLTPYMFDFMLLPEVSFVSLKRNADRQSLQRLATLFTLAKVTVIVPDDSETYEIQPSLKEWLAAKGTLQRIAAASPPWVLNLTLGLEGLPAIAGTSLGAGSVITTRYMSRHTKHEFYQPPNGYMMRRTYRLTFDRETSWDPELQRWRRVESSRGFLSGLLHPASSPSPLPKVVIDEVPGKPLDRHTSYPRVSRDGSLVTRWDVPCHPDENFTPIRLTNLAMINVQLLIGLGPSPQTRWSIWEDSTALPLFPDCSIANLCALGKRTTWCDHNAMEPDALSGAPSIRRATNRRGRVCRKRLLALFDDSGQ